MASWNMQMRKWLGRLGVAGLAFGLLACQTTPVQVAAPEVGIDGIPCVGFVPNPPGMRVVNDPALQQATQGFSNKGGLCAARVFEVTQPVMIYRVWDSRYTYTQFGKWWGMDLPTQTRDAYRADYAICPEWSALDRATACVLKVGSRIVLGTTQSAACTSLTYPKTAWIQVYMNPAAGVASAMDSCTQGEPWPIPQ